MTEKPTYQELEQRVKALEQEKRETQWMRPSTATQAHSPMHKMGSTINSEIKIAGSENKIPEEDLKAIINVEEIQSIMDEFHHLTHMVTAILDMEGNVIESTGWQDICTKFHRVHPKTACNCTESDLFLAKNLKPGEYVDYRCKNGLWDVVTPLYIGGNHLGNIFTGQFFYDDDPLDDAFFMNQADMYGFDKESYMDAYHRIPRYNRETIKHLMHFLVKFTTYISRTSLLNLKLEREMRERNKVEEEIHTLNRQLEKRVFQRTAKLEETNNELEDFVYSVSHDLRAPLRSISGFAEIIHRRHKESLNEEGQHYFENVIKASKQMGELIDELLKFSRLGRKSVKIETISLEPILKEAVATLADSIKETGTRVIFPEQMPLVQGDLTLITPVFINLLENAVRYRNPDAALVIDIGIEDDMLHVVVSISDNGIGIAPEYHEKIFKIFQRLHSQEDYPGTGIGLAAVKKAIQMMGGSVWVESEPDKGSVFKVKLLKKGI